MNRKQRRALAKQTSKQKSQEMTEKITQFENLPDECLACFKPFDKKDKQMAMTWNVVVREKTNTVRLYCPDCWSLATNAIETMKKEIENVRE